MAIYFAILRYTAVDWCQHLDLGPWFSEADLSELAARFEWVDWALQDTQLKYAAGFQETNASTRYYSDHRRLSAASTVNFV